MRIKQIFFWTCNQFRGCKNTIVIWLDSNALNKVIEVYYRSNYKSLDCFEVLLLSSFSFIISWINIGEKISTGNRRFSISRITLFESTDSE